MDIIKCISSDAAFAFSVLISVVGIIAFTVLCVMGVA